MFKTGLISLRCQHTLRCLLSLWKRYLICLSISFYEGSKGWEPYSFPFSFPSHHVSLDITLSHRGKAVNFLRQNLTETSENLGTLFLILFFGCLGSSMPFGLAFCRPASIISTSTAHHHCINSASSAFHQRFINASSALHHLHIFIKSSSQYQHQPHNHSLYISHHSPSFIIQLQNF